MKTYKKVIFLMGVALAIGCNDLIKDYKLDTNPDYLKSVSLLEYIEEGRDTSLTLYADAIRYANMEEAISGENKTRIVPTNDAIRSVLFAAGVSNLRDLPPNVVKGLFSYLTIDGAFRSIDLEPDQTIKEMTATGDSLYLSRKIVGSDRYRVSINNTEGLATAPVIVIRQDYLFSDGVAHVVDYFPTYQKALHPTDAIPPGVDYSNAKVDTLWVTQDGSVYAGGKNNNYNSGVNQLVSRSGQYRYSFFKFDVKPIDYADGLTSAQMNIFVKVINGSNFVPQMAIYETIGEWDATTLTWNTMPDFGPELVAADLALNWTKINLTGYIQNAYKDNKTELSLGFKLLNGTNITSSSVQINNMEATSGKYKAFISLRGPIPSELQLNGVSPVTVASNGIAVLTKNNISMSGPSGLYKYTDNNIIYSLMTPPTSGTLTKYGLPMTKYTQFTQEQLANGAIKFVNNGGGGDSFELKALDYIGGVYPELIQVSVMVQ